jgi:hypothetical protein
MPACASHLGPYSGEIVLTGEQLGIFPPGLRPRGLIGTVTNVGCQLGYGAANVAAARFRSLVSTRLEHLRPGA